MSEHAAENLARLLAQSGLSIHEAAAKAGLDERTVRGVLAGSNRPHLRTLHRLAEGLGVAVDEFFVDPAQLLYRRFDRQTNPLVEEVMQIHQELFAGWREADFDELHSRVGTGGCLTFEGLLSVVGHMNQKRELHEKLDVLLESSEADTVAGIVELFFQRVTISPANSAEE